MIDFSQAFKVTGKYIVEHSPAILTGFAVAGVITTTVFAAKGGSIARNILETEDGRRYEEALAALDRGESDGTPETIVTARITLKEQFFLTWRPFLPAAIAAAGTITCIIGAHGINTNRQAALIGAYALLEKGSTKYKDKVLEVVGEKKEEEVRHAIAKDTVLETAGGESKIVLMGTGEQLCLDEFSGRYFSSSMNEIQRVENEIQASILRGDKVSVNEYYSAIGLRPNKAGNNVGWNDRGHPIDLAFSSQIADDGRTCLVVQFRGTPVPDYHREW